MPGRRNRHVHHLWQPRWYASGVVKQAEPLTSMKHVHRGGRKSHEHDLGDVRGTVFAFAGRSRRTSR